MSPPPTCRSKQYHPTQPWPKAPPTSNVTGRTRCLLARGTPPCQKQTGIPRYTVAPGASARWQAERTVKCKLEHHHWAGQRDGEVYACVMHLHAALLASGRSTFGGFQLLGHRLIDNGQPRLLLSISQSRSHVNSARLELRPYQQRLKECPVDLEQPPSQVQIAGEEPRQAGQEHRRESHEVGLRHLPAHQKEPRRNKKWASHTHRAESEQLTKDLGRTTPSHDR